MPTSSQNVESSQKRISPKNAQGGERGEKPPCHRHLQKSFSDGKLVEDENNTEISAPNTQAKPHKAVKFLQTLPPPQPPISAGINQSEDEVSDRDLPELAPIDIQDYHRKSKQNFIYSQQPYRRSKCPLIFLPRSSAAEV